MKRLVFLAPFALAACDVMDQYAPEPRRTSAPATIEEDLPPPPPPDARTIEEFDTTTVEERREAAAAPSAGGNFLGETVASLGDAGTPGFWAETPLVTEVRRGRLRYPESGRSVEVELRPTTGGSTRVSLPALRLLDASLTELVTLEVYGI